MIWPWTKTRKAFDLLVLDTLDRLEREGKEVYGSLLWDELEKIRPVHLGSIYASAYRLETEGLLYSLPKCGGANRRFRDKLVWSITGDGVRYLLDEAEKEEAG